MAIFDGLFGTSSAAPDEAELGPEAELRRALAAEAASRGGALSPSFVQPSAEEELRAAVEAEAINNRNVAAVNGNSPYTQSGSYIRPTRKPVESRDSQALNRARAYMIPRESGGDYRASNQYGYQGAYQFGRDALVDLGFIRSDAPKGNAALQDPKNWTGKAGINSLEDFLASQPAQDDAFTDYASRNMEALRKRGVIRDDSTVDEMAGHIGVAHGYGVGGATELALRGVDMEDGNRQSAANLYRNISGSNAAVPTRTVEPIRAAMMLNNDGADAAPSSAALSSRNVSAPTPGVLSSGGGGMDVARMIQELYAQPRPERRERLDSGVADAMIALGAGMIGGDFGGGAMAASEVLNNARQRRIAMAREDEANEFTRKQNLLNLAIAAQNADTNAMRTRAIGNDIRPPSTETDIARSYNKEIAALPEKISEFNRTISNLNTLESILDSDEVNTGPLAGSTVGQMAQRLNPFGNPAAVENFNQIASELALAGRSLLEGSGAISNYEQQLVQNMKPSPSYDEQTNRDIIARMRYAAQLSKEKAALRQSIHRNGWTPEGEDEFTRQWGARIRELEKESPLASFEVKGLPKNDDTAVREAIGPRPKWMD